LGTGCRYSSAWDFFLVYSYRQASSKLDEGTLGYIFGQRIHLVEIVLGSLLAAELGDVVEITTQFRLSEEFLSDGVFFPELLVLKNK
jgi:hypothetical protein